MPTDDLYAAQWALLGVESGWSVSAALDRFRAEGGHIGTQTFYRLTAEIKATVSNRADKYSEPVNRIPVASEIQRWTTQHAKGYVQQVEVLVRDKATGQVISVPYSGMSKTLRSRRSVLKEALSVYSDENAEKYEQQILGAVYTGTYQAVPEGG